MEFGVTLHCSRAFLISIHFLWNNLNNENVTAIGLSVSPFFFALQNQRIMDIIQALLKEFNEEAAITRKMLQRVPEDKWDWKPHAKSMSMESLSVHVAELPSWIKMGLTTSELDFAAAPYEPTKVESTAALLDVFEKAVVEGRQALAQATEADLLPTWTLRNGEQVYGVYTKYEIIRHAMAQTIHHRAQLGVHLRLLDIPIPGSYGPSADDMSF